ncbi:MAG: DUF2069 domain-containing protein [Xanthomonadales bacterium]|nr:DUF2069 domain-containing protein [Xanthomonadales bacterium]
MSADLLASPGLARPLAVVRVGLLALLVLQLVWHGLLPPPRSALGWTALALTVLPLLAVLPGAWRGRPLPLFWANLLALVYFCHGVTEAWTEPAQRGLALLEVALAVLVVCAYGLLGIRSRRAARAAGLLPPRH